MNGNYNDSLRDMDWDENAALPIANAENKLLEETISKKLVERNKFQSELAENSAKANALKDHIKNVKDELLSAQKLLEARRNELQTENHLKSIAEREKGRLWQENERLENELEKLKEKRNMHEVRWNDNPRLTLYSPIKENVEINLILICLLMG